MKAVCVIAVFFGAAILFLGIALYYRMLQSFRRMSQDNKMYGNAIYLVCMLLMVFFFIGYVVLGISFIPRKTVDGNDLLISAVFFFGAIFVLVVNIVQNKMTATIDEKNDELIKTLVNAMEAKDHYTRGHSAHVLNLIKLFYEHLPKSLHGRIDYGCLTDAAILHDIGKIGITDAILNKPGKLTEEEMAVIRTHPRMGKQILKNTSYSALGDIILLHHERGDNDGYYRIPFDEVPIESKMIAIADTFSALYSDRVYRPRKSYAAAVEIMKEAKGVQLDPALTDIFLSIPEEEINDATRGMFSMED